MQFRPRINENQNEIVSNLRGNADFQTHVVLGCVHRPFHNKEIWDKVLQLCNDLGPSLNSINLIGDYIDLYTLGSYNAESLGLLRDIDLEYEYADGLKGIKEIEEAIDDKCTKRFLFGNHEDRYWREINKKDNAKYGGALLNPVNALELDKRNWHFKTNWKDDYFTLGDHLDLMHGVFHNEHAAKKHLEESSHSVMFAHTHRIQQYFKGNRGAFNIGFLGDINNKAFGYAPRLQRQRWVNGFAVVYTFKELFFVNQINCVDNKFIYNYKIY